MADRRSCSRPAIRLMYRLAYRNLADGHEALVVNHSVKAVTSVGIRWYELRNPAGGTMASGTSVVYQQGTYAPDAGCLLQSSPRSTMQTHERESRR